MAVRGWAWSIAAATGAAACAGAAQLGIGYGFGIVAWRPVTDPASQAVWLTSLTWTTWVAASATVLGAVHAARRPAGTDATVSSPAGAPVPSAGGATAAGAPADPADPPVHAGVWRLALAIAAAVGAAVTVALVSVPAQAALRADTFSPQTIAGGYAVLGIMLGIPLAVWALASRAAAVNVVATAGWLGLLAVVAAAFRIWSRQAPYSPPPGFWRMTPDTDRFWLGTIYWPGAALTLGTALLIGILAATAVARQRANRLGVALCGAAGPLMVAAAYFVAAPRLTGIRGDQTSTYLIAPYAVLAGLAGSVLVAVLGQRRRHGDRDGSAARPAASGSGEPVAAHPLAHGGSAASGDASDAGTRPGRARRSGTGPASGPTASPVPEQPGAGRTGARPAGPGRPGVVGADSPTGQPAPAPGQARGQAAVVAPPDTATSTGDPGPGGPGASRRRGPAAGR